ncbi:MAG: DUF6178 family protein [Desulfobacteraceae bacterium]|nr:DUF6178 family protein [Desulfobacteraceae bacterium]
MNEDNQEDKEIQIRHKQRLARLAEEKRRVLAKQPEKALDEILEHPQATALVHSMAEEDLFFLVHDIGPEDALELLSLASNRQWEYILDVEIWKRDRISTGALTHWMNLLAQADPERFTQWIMEEKPELLEYYLQEAVEILVIEDQEDPGDFPDGFFTYDGVFYTRIKDQFLNAIEDEETRDQREHFIYRMLERLADEDHLGYQSTLLRSANVMPSESEEESFRLRNIRLAEKGFLPFDEAIGIYAPMRPESVRKRSKKFASTDAETDFTVPVPVQPSALMSGNTVFSTALWKIDVQELLNELQIEFAALCNRIIAADQQPIRGREELRHTVHKTCGYLSLGIHRLAGTDELPAPEQSVSILRSYSLEDIFRTGWGLVMELKEKARKWKTRSWFAKNNLALSFWGERLVGYIGGLLLTRPRYFDNYQTGQMYREFESLADISKAATALEEAINFDEIFSCVAPDMTSLPEKHFLTHENLLLTLWARDRLGLEAAPKSVPVETYKPFFQSLWSSGKNVHLLQDSAKSDFLAWLRDATGFTEPELSRKAGRAIENLFSKIEDEYGSVSEKDLDPRFVHLFILKKT